MCWLYNHVSFVYNVHLLTVLAKKHSLAIYSSEMNLAGMGLVIVKADYECLPIKDTYR